ncbi:MAG: hypothetical protein AAF720_12735 [Pseudomonadota bacterium]
MPYALKLSRKKPYTIILLTMIGYSFGILQNAYAEETRLVIRALANDAKFIGTGMSGMEVLIRDA